MIKKFIARSDFNLVYDSLWAVTAAYAKPLFCELLGCDESILRHAEAKDDFGGGHPDPNLTYAKVRPDSSLCARAQRARVRYRATQGCIATPMCGVCTYSWCTQLHHDARSL